MSKQVLVTGAAGFVGSHLVDRLLNEGNHVIGIDNFVRGTKANLKHALQNPHFKFFEHDLADEQGYMQIIAEVSKVQAFTTVWHMAANSDIAAGVADPNVDLINTFMTTFTTLNIMRKFEIPYLAFASSSAIYGDKSVPLMEDIGPLFPISNYGAMKLASEALISAAVESYLEKAFIFRFPNVIGSRATHGVIYDLMNKLKLDNTRLEVLGNGQQQKPYLHVSELIDAMQCITANANDPINYYNIGANDDGVTVRFIAESIVNCVAPQAKIEYTGGSKGWVGDVPRFSYCIDKIGKLGWQPKLSSAEALVKAVKEISQEIFG